MEQTSKELETTEGETETTGNCCDSVAKTLQGANFNYVPPKTFEELGVNDRLHLMFCYLEKLAQLQSVNVNVFGEIEKVNTEIQREIGL